MWPRKLPDWVTGDRRRRAEIEVYRQIAATLDDEWEAFYSRPWWGISRRGGEEEGEADFILAHADRGMLFVEVKGGGVAYDPATSEWTSVDQNAARSFIKDPVLQATRCKHRFIERLRALEDWPRAFVRFRHGAVFPDSEEPGREVVSIAGYERRLFCFAGEFRHAFDKWVESRLAQHDGARSQPESPPGRAGVDLLRKLVADPVRLRVPLHRVIRAELEAQEVLLTGQQLTAISLLQQVQRALVEGAAGTGKTLLALEMATRLSDEGLRTLLVCFSRPLAMWLSERLKAHAQVTVSTFHALCSDLATAAGPIPQVNGEGLHEAVLPDLASGAISRGLGDRWDAVLVDEGQDFLPSWWDIVEGVLRNPPGILRVFYDSNQTVYARKDDLETRLRAQAFSLGLNLRNTRAIARVTDRFYSGPRVETPGPEGVPPSEEAVKGGDAHGRVVELIANILREGGMRTDDVAVLVPTDGDVERVGRALSGARLGWRRADQSASGAVTVDTIRRFKGLEAPVVILLVDRATAQGESAYVAVSRARSRLLVLGTATGTPLARALAEASASPGRPQP